MTIINNTPKVIKIDTHVAMNKLEEIFNLIDNGSLDDFILFAKDYNIFQENGTGFYKLICDKIRKRLAKENLSENIIMPEVE